MKSVNQVFVLGYLGSDPVQNKTNSGYSVCNFSVACDESYKSDKGDLVAKTEWINCSAFGAVADICIKYLKKGDRVHIQGKLRTDTAEKNGEKRYYTKVKIEELLMLSGKKKDENTESAVTDGKSFSIPLIS